MYHCFFCRHVCLPNLKHTLSSELPLTAHKTVLSHLKYSQQRAGPDLTMQLDKKYPNLVSTQFRIHSVFKNFHSGEQIQKVADLCARFAKYVWMKAKSTTKKFRAVIKRRGPGGFPPATMNVAFGFFHRKIEEKLNQKKSLVVLSPAYLLYSPSYLKLW